MTPDKILIIRSDDQTELHVFADGYSLPRATLIFEGQCDVQVKDHRKVVLRPRPDWVSETFEAYERLMNGPDEAA